MHRVRRVKDIMALALRFRVVFWIVPSDTLCVNTMDADNESDLIQRMPTMHRRLEQVGKGQSIREVSDFYPNIIVFSSVESL